MHFVPLLSLRSQQVRKLFYLLDEEGQLINELVKAKLLHNHLQIIFFCYWLQFSCLNAYGSYYNPLGLKYKFFFVFYQTLRVSSDNNLSVIQNLQWAYESENKKIRFLIFEVGW